MIFHFGYLSNKSPENHEAYNLPYVAGWFGNCEEVYHNVVPEPFANERNDDDREEEGKERRNEFHVDFTALYCVAGPEISEAINSSITGAL